MRGGRRRLPRMRAAWNGLAILLVALAGCNDAPTTAGPPAGATATTGILHGIVLDDVLRPLAGVHVNATFGDQSWNASTSEDGRFRFTGLAPGTYFVEASKPQYGRHQVAAVVLAGVEEPPLQRLQLAFEVAARPFATLYKHEGYHECGMNAMRVCSNVNILTWIVVCGQSGGALCPGNVTGDRSLFFQDIDGPPSFIQAELVWDATLPTGTELSFLLGGGTEDELKGGVALPAYNYTSGPSPLMARVSNHEGPGAWCRNVPDPPCEERALEGSKLGVERALLVQVDAGPSQKVPACVPPVPGITGQPTCGAGWSMQQAFTLYTSVFYGFEPPAEWRYTDEGQLPDAPL